MEIPFEYGRLAVAKNFTNRKKELLPEKVNQFSSKETLEKYNLGTSGNVVKLKKTLVNKLLISATTNSTFLIPCTRAGCIPVILN